MRYARRATSAGLAEASTRNSANKVQLAAIVHHELICSHHDRNGISLPGNSQSDDKQAQETKANSQRKELVDSKRSSYGRGKLSRLFSRSRRKGTNDLEADCQSGENDITNYGRKQTMKTNANGNSNRGQISDELAPKDSNYSHPKALHQKCIDKSSETNRDRVIEFKFDLIVDQLTPTTTTLPNLVDNTNKLGDQVNELVESFVLAATDACLMSIGGSTIVKRQQLARFGGEQVNMNDRCEANKLPQHLAQVAGEQRAHKGGFDYLLNRFISPSLVYAFDLLSNPEARRRMQTENEAEGCKDKQTNDDDLRGYSIELGAMLCIRSEQIAEESRDHNEDNENHSGGPPTRCVNYSIIDLLDQSPPSSRVRDFSSASSSSFEAADGGRAEIRAEKVQSASIDCVNLGEAHKVIEQIRVALEKLDLGEQFEKDAKESKLLLVSLMLKQHINGGLFSNRLCFIDLDPKFLELNQFLESIFTGQARAHLKRHKMLIETLESSSQSANSKKPMRSPDNCSSIRRSFSSLSRDQLAANSSTGSNNNDHQFNAHSNRTSESEQWISNKQQFHQIASENRLIQIKWLLYRQLSSALIQTLLVVHVHKLTRMERSPTGKEELNCFCSIGSAIKRLDLIERQLMANNLVQLEFARSIQQAASTRLKRRKRHLRSHLASSNVSVASKLSASIDEPSISSPQRTTHDADRPNNSKRLMSHTIARHQSVGISPYRKASLDTSLALARFHRRHFNQHHHRASNSMDQNQYKNKKRLQQLAATESGSPMSTSSGGQAKSSSNCDNNENDPLTVHTPNLSDSTDSITSANLNSYCSLVSFNQPASRQQRIPRQRYDVELEWISKQNPPRSSTVRKQPNDIVELVDLDFSRPRAQMQSVNDPLRGNVIKIDCHPNGENLSLKTTSNHLNGMAETKDSKQLAENHIENFSELDNTDNVSDICSIVAEPPKQLKLEEFLNQLSSIIAPGERDRQHLGQMVERKESISKSDAKDDSIGFGAYLGESASLAPNGYSSSVEGELMADTEEGFSWKGRQSPVQHRNGDLHPNVSLQVDEDDEDCKSHSSILEHLSSLAFESNTKLNNHQQPHQLRMLPLDAPTNQQEQNGEFLHLESPVCDSLVTAIPKIATTPSRVTTLSGLQIGQVSVTQTGHLQRLLNSSSQLRGKLVSNGGGLNSHVTLKDPNEVHQFDDQPLRLPLSISCCRAAPISSLALSGPSSAFTSSNNSSCSSSSSSDNNNNNILSRHANPGLSSQQPNSP